MMKTVDFIPVQVKCQDQDQDQVPLKIWTRPTTMIRPRAMSLPTVNTSWILVAIRTLEQLTQVSSTGSKKHKRHLQVSSW